MVSVSFDGPDASSHDPVRGPGTYAKALRGLRYLIEAKRESSALVGISGVISAKNIKSAVSFLDMAQELGCDYLVLAQVHPVGNAVANWQQLNVSLEEIVQCGIKIAQRMAEGTAPEYMRVGFFTPLFVQYLNAKYGFDLPIPQFMDKTALYECYIQCDGRVFPSQKSSQMVPNVLNGLQLD